MSPGGVPPERTARQELWGRRDRPVRKVRQVRPAQSVRKAQRVILVPLARRDPRV